MSIQITASNLIAKVKLYWRILKLLWKYRAVIVAFVKDGDKLVTLVDTILLARLEGKGAAKKAQEKLNNHFSGLVHHEMQHEARKAL